MPGLNFLSRLSTKLRCFLSSKVLAVSNSVGSALKEIAKTSNIETFYNGISVDIVNDTPNITRESMGISSKSLVIANVAFHAQIKGVDILLEAFSKVITQHPCAVLLQMGAENSKGGTEKLKKLAEELGISANVIWIGATNNVHSYLKLADLYCHTSRSEGFGRAIIEAMLHKLPVVATNVGGVSEIISDDKLGKLVDSGEPDRIALSLSYFIENKAKRIEVGEAGYKNTIKCFNAESQAKKLYVMYKAMGGK